MLYKESTLITWKLTMKDLRSISISISPCTSQRVPSKALIIIVLGRISDKSTFKHSRVPIRQTFRSYPLSINTLAIIMPSHLIAICMAKVWSFPFKGSSSSKTETWLEANTNDTIPSKEECMMPAETYVSFNTFKRASRWTSEDNNNAKIEI